MAEATGQGAQAETLHAIAAREHRRIRAELRERRRRQAPETAEPATGWSTKPDRSKRRKGAASTALEKRAGENKSRWARRHPRIAAEEKQLRKERIARRSRWSRTEDGTAETHERAARRNEGRLVQLYRNEVIDAEQLAAAEEIALVHERIGAAVAVKTASLETRVDMTRSGDGSFFERLANVRREIAYTRWRHQAEGPIGAVLEMIVGDRLGFTVVAQRYGMHHRKARRLLIAALSLWPTILKDVCREVDHKALARAQARVLA